MSDLERIGKLILYRNKILEKILRELQKEFPSMDILLEEFVRLLEAIDDLDNDVIATIAKLRGECHELKKTVSTNEEGAVSTEATDNTNILNLEEWLTSVLNSLNGSRESIKDYIMALKQEGGICWASKLMSLLGIKKNHASMLESELEKRGILKSIDAGGRKLVFFNHPTFTNLTVNELIEKLKPVRQQRSQEG